MAKETKFLRKQADKAERRNLGKPVGLGKGLSQSSGCAEGQTKAGKEAALTP
jgi:hypothetical protein